MHLRNAALATAFVTLCASAVSAQVVDIPAGPSISGVTPGECMKGANDWRNKAFSGMPTAERTSATYNALQNEAQRIATDCGGKLALSDIPPAGIPDLVNYYNFVGDTAAARTALARGLATKGMAPRELAKLLTLEMSREMSLAAGHFGIIEGAERVIKRIDALPDDIADVKADAHSRMLNQYEYLDVADGIENHAQALLRLARLTKNKANMTAAYGSLARASADKLHPEKAMQILDQGDKELEMPAGKTAFEDFRHRIALIGQPATAVTGNWWVNTDKAPRAITPGNGKVTLVEFTAHWCAPCRNSYPGIRTVAERFKDQPFQGVMVTGLYGYLGDKRNLKPEEEVAADRIYFKEHGVPFPVAVNPDEVVPGVQYSQPVIDKAYRVGGIPQIVIIDKKGVIRQIVIGWDAGNTERFSTYIQQLLNEN